MRREESVEVGLVIPHGEQRTAREIGPRPGVVPAAGSEQAPERETVDSTQARPIDAETSQDERRLRRVAHERGGATRYVPSAPIVPALAAIHTPTRG